jgi:glucose-1-phosphatase
MPEPSSASGPIQVIVSDFGGVVCTFDYHIFCRRLADRIGRSPETIHGCAFGCELQMRLESGQLTGPAYHQRLMEELGAAIGYEEFCELYGDIFTEAPEMVDLLGRLRQRYPLLLLSDTNEIHFGFVRPRLASLRLFDHLVLSYEVGAMKPDVRMYDEVVRRAGVPAQACLFMDDRLANVEAARRAGMSAFLFQSVDQCRLRLEEFGVVVPS